MGSRLFLLLALVEGLFVLMVLCAIVAGESFPHAKSYVSLIPILMLSDYYLTILSAWLTRKINPRIDLACAELNPMWKADVAKLRLFNIRHFIHVSFMASVLLILSQAPSGFPRGVFDVLFGYLVGMNASLVAEHCHHLITMLTYQRSNVLSLSPSESPKLRYVAARSFVLLLLLSASSVLGVWFLLGGVVGQLAQIGLRINLERQALRNRDIGNRQFMCN